MWLFLIFVVTPIVEIALFIKAGGILGLWPTLAIVVLTAFVGTTLLRRQGLATLSRLQGSLNEGQNPMDPIAHGALIIVSGVLLLTPGFFTDTIGLALLLPPIRAGLIKWGAARLISSSSVVFTSASTTRHSTQTDRTNAVDGEFVILDDDDTEAKETDSSGRPG